MVGMRNDRARARARDLLATVYPVPDDVEFQRLRELAVDYIREAERLEAANRGREAESDELISAALDAVARDYFSRPRPVRPRSIHRIQPRGLGSRPRAARLHEYNRLQVHADAGIQHRREPGKPSPANPWHVREHDHFSCRP